MRHWLVRGLIVATAVGAAASAPSARQSGRLSIQDAVAHYAGGDFATAVSDLDTQGLKVAPFTRALEAWIAAGDPASAPRRRRVAAAFALDAVWAATRTTEGPEQYRRFSSAIDPERASLISAGAQPLVARWAVLRLPATGPLDAFERALWLAAVGIAEDSHAWRRLQDDILPLARKRLPDEPRVRLADVLARTNLELGTLRPSGMYAGTRRESETLRDDRLGLGVAGRIPQAIRAFEPLLADPALAGEVELRIGYLELRRRQWPGALARLDAARAKTAEPALRAAADYLAGWVHEQQDQADAAIAAYRRALTIAPTMRNVATRLSALLYLRNERTEAYAVLDRALNARPAPVDLLVMVERADARFVPDWLASIRRALQ